MRVTFLPVSQLDHEHAQIEVNIKSQLNRWRLVDKHMSGAIISVIVALLSAGYGLLTDDLISFIVMLIAIVFFAVHVRMLQGLGGY